MNNWLSRQLNGGDQNKQITSDETLDVFNQEPGIQPTTEQIETVLAGMVKAKEVIMLANYYYLKST